MKITSEWPWKYVCRWTIKKIKVQQNLKRTNIVKKLYYKKIFILHFHSEYATITTKITTNAIKKFSITRFRIPKRSFLMHFSIYLLINLLKQVLYWNKVWYKHKSNLFNANGATTQAQRMTALKFGRKLADCAAVVASWLVCLPCL